ncbi:MAG: sensor histidine kinase [Prolixibacteraceae bacterium]
MEIRKKLTYQFIALVAVILLISSAAIYISFSKTRMEEFYNRLESKAILTAQMLIEIDEIDLDLLDKIEKNNPLSLPNEKILIYDYQNELMFSTDKEFQIENKDRLLNEIRMEGNVHFMQNGYEVIGLFYTSQFDRIIVFIAAQDIFGIKKIVGLRNILVLVFIASLMIVFLVARLFAARALKPISEIINQVNGITATNLDERLAIGNGKDELARLAMTFNQMLERIEGAFKIQKNFIANASHELRTPLTVITGQLEVVLMKPRDVQEYKNSLESVLDDIRNLNQISNRLLLLAQTDSQNGEKDFIPIRIDEALWQAQQELQKRHSNYVVLISFDDEIDDEAKLMIMGNLMLIKTVFTNLIDNACKYSSNKRATVSIRSQQSGITISIIDEGIGIPTEEISMIFQPFYRAKNTIGITGHGVGLSIVDKIMTLHRGTIQVKSKPGEGTVFTIELPIVH